MSRTTIFIALLQTVLIVTGFFALGLVMKMHGYPDLSYFRFNGVALFLRQYGPWFLLLPIAWVCFATVAEHRGRGFFSPQVAIISGALIAGLIICLFLYAAVFPGAWPILIHVPSIRGK